MNEPKFTPVELPQAYINFAKACANIADAHGIKRFVLKIDPSFEASRLGIINYGEMQVIFASVDGRGRPCRNLKIEVNTTLKHDIESNPSSFS